MPLGLAIDPGSGLISGIVDASAAETSGGSYPVTVMADNGQGHTGSATFTWNVAHTNQAPVVDNPGDTLNVNGDSVSWQIGASDPDGDPVTYSATGLPLGLTVNATSGVISGTVGASASASSPYAVTVSASDGTLSASQTFTWTVTTGAVVVTQPSDATNTEGDAVSLQVAATNPYNLALTYSATGLPTGLSINTTGLISGTVASGAAEGGSGGTYLVTVVASDAQGDSGAQQFYWSINAPVLGPSLTNPGSQTNAEGNTVCLQVQASDPDGNGLTYIAVGLPPGLAIDPNTGLISGIINYTAAEIAGGQYATLVAVNDGQGNTVSQSFSWTVSDTARAPWLASPGLQDSLVGATIALPLEAGSADNASLTFSATGLPTGLAINTATGQIGGTVTAAAGSYSVTVTASAEGLGTSQSFTWDVSNSFAPQVTLAINGTLDHSDDVAFVNPATPMPVVVTLNDAGPGIHQVTITIPSGRSILDSYTFQLADGGSTTVTLTPVQASAAEDDVILLASVDGQAAGQGAETNEILTLPSHIRAADTPADMGDRIPDVNPTSFTVGLSVPLTHSGERVILNVTGQSSANGTVNFIGPDGEGQQLIVTATTTFGLVGLAQTQPTADGLAGNAFKLRLVAQVGAVQVMMVNAFSIAPIITTVTAKDAKIVGANNVPAEYKWDWAVYYTMALTFDGGNGNNIMMKEVLHDVDKTGMWTNFATTGGQWSLASAEALDRNGYHVNGEKVPNKSDAVAIAQKRFLDPASPGHENMNQTIVYVDLGLDGTPKLGAVEHTVAKSGFWISCQTPGEQAANGLSKLLVWRTAQANNGAEAGILDKNSEGQFMVAV